MVKSSKKSKGQTRNIIADEETNDQQVKAQAMDAVLPETSIAYQRRIWSMKQWLRERDKPTTPMSDKDFSRFLVSHKGGIKSGSTARNWRSTLKKWRTLEGVAEENSAATALLDTQIRGITYQAGNAVQVSADVIDSGRLGDMTRLLIKWKHMEYALHFIFVFYSMFRKTRGANVLVSDVRFDTDIGTTIASKRTKYANSLKVEPGAIGNFKEVGNLTSFLKDLTKGKKPEERLFPNYVEKTANDLIKRCAQHLNWGSGKWCVLSLRHGGSREAQAVLEDEPSAEIKKALREQQVLSKRMGHSNPRSKKRYQKSKGTKGVKKSERLLHRRAMAGMY